MSIQVKSIDVYSIHDRLRKDKSKEGKEVWNYVKKLNEALTSQQRLTGEAISKLRKVSPDMKLFKEARDTLLLCTLVDKSGQAETLVAKIDAAHPEFNK